MCTGTSGFARKELDGIGLGDTWASILLLSSNKFIIAYPCFIHIQCLDHIYMYIYIYIFIYIYIQLCMYIYTCFDDVFVASLFCFLLSKFSRITRGYPTAARFPKRGPRHRPMRAEVCSCEDIGSTIDLTSW